ncbi:MAG: STAS domain-containing protein [Phycisphaerae bacterium]
MSDVIEAVTHEDGGIVVRLTGEIDLHQSPQFHQQLVALCDEQPQRLILDLSAVRYIDSSGVGSMVEIFRRLKKEGRLMILVSPSERVRGVLEITRLDEFFTIVGSADEALKL